MKHKKGKYDTEKEVGGFARNDHNARFFTTPMEWNGRKNWTHVYIPCRTALVSPLLIGPVL